MCESVITCEVLLRCLQKVYSRCMDCGFVYVGKSFLLVVLIAFVGFVLMIYILCVCAVFGGSRFCFLGWLGLYADF